MRFGVAKQIKASPEPFCSGLAPFDSFPSTEQIVKYHYVEGVHPQK